MKIGIVGYGTGGQVALDYWKDKGEVTVCDDNNVTVPDEVHTQLGENYLADLSRFDLIVRSPQVKPDDLIAAVGRDILGKVTTPTNEFFGVSPSQNIIGICGSEGKNITAALIAKLIQASGKGVYQAVSVDTPALALLKGDIKPEDWVVLELTSAQLVDCNHSPHIAICLGVAPRGLDGHSETDEYFYAKTQLFRHQTQDDVAIYLSSDENSKRIAFTGKGWKIPYCDEPGATIRNGMVHIGNEDICKASELGLKGKDIWQHVCAAVTAVWQISRNKEQIKQVLAEFNPSE